jgi:IS1 family transposase
MLMNKLDVTQRAAIVRSLCEGNSVRATSRLTGTSKGAVLRLLVEVGEFCEAYQFHALVKLPCKRIEADEIWGFVGAKEARKVEGKGDLWTYIAVDSDSKLVVTWLCGSRTRESTHEFMHDLASRLANRIQLSTDALVHYQSAVEAAFGWNGVDFAQIQKKYGQEDKAKSHLGRYSPSPVVVGIEKVVIMGKPDMKNVSTSFVERQNLTVRMSIRRMTRLTNAFSKKAENHAHAFAMHMMYYNFCRTHITLSKANGGIRTTPAMASGLTDHVWTAEEILELMDPNRLLH